MIAQKMDGLKEGSYDMRIIKSFTLFILIGIATVGLTVTTAMAAIVALPTGLNPGEQYRLAFVTSGTTDALSTNIAFYNAFVQAAADGSALLALDLEWKAIASTGDTDARDNTDTNPFTSTGVKIFRIDGTLLAVNNAGLWDPAFTGILAPLSFNEDGEEHDAMNQAARLSAWTGTNIIGVEHITDRGLGNPLPIVGAIFQNDARWIARAVPNVRRADFFHMYAISETLTAPVNVIPLPAALPLYGTGLALMGFMGWRRKRQALRD